MSQFWKGIFAGVALIEVFFKDSERVDPGWDSFTTHD
jgi:hypothetical protein